MTRVRNGYTYADRHGVVRAVGTVVGAAPVPRGPGMDPPGGGLHRPRDAHLLERPVDGGLRPRPRAHRSRDRARAAAVGPDAPAALGRRDVRGVHGAAVGDA